MEQPSIRGKPKVGEAKSEFRVETRASLQSVGREAFEKLVGDDLPPFLSFDWLDALEHTGCVEPERGWLPLHLLLLRGEDLVAMAPAYIKGNSEGEFVFDHQWAHFSEARLGVAYYPKLIVAVPFTPATGPRLIIGKGYAPQVIVDIMQEGIQEICQRMGLSGAHVLFPDEEEANQWERAGALHRIGVQFHWRNRGYASFDDFLRQALPSKRRTQIRRERRALVEQGVRLSTLTGTALSPELADIAYELYLSTVDKFVWGRQYLNRAFFREVFRRLPERIQLVLARDRDGQVLAGAFNLIGRRTLYGRYWGAFSELPFLHFNVCYYHGVEYCIEHGLELFEPGAGGEHKRVRGFEPTLTHSVHILSDPRLTRVIADFLQREREILATMAG